ncbi:helix-turn-helix domain protein [Ochrobactrum quorumnocens]|uniref:Helix-turn-helix domain protein n=1 Tax=Ochrobactrum quorumnocens TaxID=271865 RepID=A0A248UBK5_9HYPH|nr:AraC family transcriptional regulator [[Ochrobactrum] quorumnocens]ASV84173.1 helix-turn-helix domain protein [[Ochrobactrum] quorumnocens]
MNSSWKYVIKDRWGSVRPTENGTVMRVVSGPDGTDFSSSDYMALVTIIPVDKELAIESDRFISVRDLAGSFRLASSGIHYRSRWNGNCNAIGSAMPPERLRTIAGETFDDENFNFCVPKIGIIDKKILLLSKLLIEENSQPYPSTMALEALQILFWVHLLRQYSTLKSPPFAKHKGGLSPRTLKTVLSYVRDNLSDVTIIKMAEAAGLSGSHFLRSFQLATGQSPHQFVIQCRLERAVQLIRENQLQLNEVAKACGFSSHSHMTVLVKKHWGVTPKQLRD